MATNFYDKASLVMIPDAPLEGEVLSVKPEDRSGDFTFTRSTAATRVNADGNIEKQTGNYILHSQEIENSYWNKYNFSVTANQAPAPDGTTTADLIDDGTGSSIHVIEESATTGFGGAVTASIHAKYVDTQYLVLAVFDTSYNAVAFDIQNGTIGNKSPSSLIATIEDLGSGWYRCAVTNPTNTRINPFYSFGLRDDNAAAFYTSTGSNRQAYVWGAQLEDGLVARDYIETTTAAVDGGITDNLPRLDYTDSSCPALLLEPQRTNALKHSEYYEGGAGFAAANLNIQTNYTQSPEGVVNASRLETTGGFPSLRVLPSPTLTAGDNTWSVFVKYESSRFIILRSLNFTNGDNSMCWFDIENGEKGGILGDTVTYDIEDYGNGWYRCYITFNVDASDIEGNVYVYLSDTDESFGSNIGNAAYLYGAQLEVGSYATSYIPTYGTSVTRNVDSSYKINALDLLGQTEGTIFLDFIYGANSSTNIIFQIRRMSGVSKQIDIRIQSDKLRAFGSSGGINQFDMQYGAVNEGTRYKCAVRYQNNNSAFYVNGALVSTDTDCDFAVGELAQISFAESLSALVEKQYIKQALVFKTALDDDELAALTTI